MIIGSHVSLSAPDYLLGAVKDAISYDANALMIYTGAPQNTIRKPTKDFKIEEDMKDLTKIGTINIDVRPGGQIDLYFTKEGF